MNKLYIEKLLSLVLQDIITIDEIKNEEYKIKITEMLDI